MSVYRIDYHSDLHRYFLYIDAGTDPTDGAPLSYATPLTPSESLLWQQGETERLERALRQRGIPLPGACGLRTGKFRRFLSRLRTLLIGARKGAT